jgi:hypothetical protein
MIPYHVKVSRAKGRLVRNYRGVRYVAKGRRAPVTFKAPCTCGHCGRTWDDAHVSELTPAPAARCPFEYMHRYRKGEST